MWLFLISDSNFFLRFVASFLGNKMRKNIYEIQVNMHLSISELLDLWFAFIWMFNKNKETTRKNLGNFFWKWWIQFVRFDGPGAREIRETEWIASKHWGHHQVQTVHCELSFCTEYRQLCETTDRPNKPCNSEIKRKIGKHYGWTDWEGINKEIGKIRVGKIAQFTHFSLWTFIECNSLLLRHVLRLTKRYGYIWYYGH